MFGGISVEEALQNFLFEGVSSVEYFLAVKEIFRVIEGLRDGGWDNESAIIPLLFKEEDSSAFGLVERRGLASRLASWLPASSPPFFCPEPFEPKKIYFFNFFKIYQ